MNDCVRGTRATYDVIASAYAQRWAAATSWAADWVGRLGAVLPAGACVGDVGCGPGQYTTLLRDHGFRVVGVDLSAGMLASLGVSGLVQADMRALPLTPSCLDAIWCSAALLHVPRPDVPAVLAEFARVLRPGGYLALSVAEGDGEDWEAVPYQPELRRWYVRHRLEPLTALLDEAGFTVRQYWRHRSHRDWLYIHATARV